MSGAVIWAPLIAATAALSGVWLQSHLTRRQSFNNRLREQLSSPELMAAYVEAFNAERRQSQDAATRDRSKTERRRAEVVTLHPAAIQAYRRDLYSLSRRIGSALADNSEETRRAFHALVSDVIVTINDPYEPATVEVRGRL